MPVDLREFKQAFQPDNREDVFRTLRDLVSRDLAGGRECIRQLAHVPVFRDVVKAARQRLSVLERIFGRAEALALSNPQQAAKVLKKVRDNVLEMQAQLRPEIDSVNMQRDEPPA